MFIGRTSGECGKRCKKFSTDHIKGGAKWQQQIITYATRVGVKLSTMQICHTVIMVSLAKVGSGLMAT